MCGIFGYIGKRDTAATIVLEGLKTLEYRGYDSWGIAVQAQKGIVVDKHVGKIGNATTNLPQSTIGIGHTRWATHGGVTVENAHPHLDCTKTIAVLHNGIIENFSEIKEELIKKGHIFISETDTEVASHLIEENLKTQDFQTSVRNAFNRLTGMNALVILHAPTSQVIAVKNGSPLVVGKGKEEFFIASDAAGVLKHTKDILFVEDNYMVTIGNYLTLEKLPGGEKVSPVFQTLDWNIEDAEKGTYTSFFEKEMHEQPQILRTIALNSLDNTKELALLIKKSYGAFMVACGSAAHSGIAGTYLFSRIAKRHINFAIGSEFKYHEDFITSKTLVIPISQSGESIDVIEPVKRAKQKGATIAAIVNVLGSTLYRVADKKVMLLSGPEKCVVATKSFLSMLAMQLLTSYAVAERQDEAKELLLRSAEDIEEILSKKYRHKITSAVAKLKKNDHVYILGRGLSYATALEAALKLKESCYIHAEGFAGGELKHGVIALVEKGTPVIVFAPNDETYDEIISNAQEVKARGAFVLGIGPKNNGVFDLFLPTKDVGDATMLSQVVIAQLLAYHLALARGIKDPDMPRNLAKSVTVK